MTSLYSQKRQGGKAEDEGERELQCLDCFRIFSTAEDLEDASCKNCGSNDTTIWSS